MELQQRLPEISVLGELSEGIEGFRSATVLIDIEREKRISWWRDFRLALPARQDEFEIKQVREEGRKLLGSLAGGQKQLTIFIEDTNCVMVTHDLVANIVNGKGDKSLHICVCPCRM